MSFSPGERVTRKSHNHDLLFRISSITGDTAILHGEDIRLAADAPLDDLVYVQAKDLALRKQKEKEQVEFSYRLFSQDYRLMKEKREYETGDGYLHTAGYFQLPLRVLHVDGDQTYLRKCMELYKRVGMQVQGVHMLEKEMPDQIGELVDKVNPHIIVITGHDAFSRNKGPKDDLRAYRHSKYFIETVEIIRQKNPRLDELVIFAGACQSHFESLIRAGANFASAPSRINIHALDPVYIAARVAYTPFMEKVGIWDVLRNTLTGEKGLGGVETKGLLRMGMPHTPEDEDGNQSV